MDRSRCLNLALALEHTGGDQRLVLSIEKVTRADSPHTVTAGLTLFEMLGKKCAAIAI